MKNKHLLFIVCLFLLRTISAQVWTNGQNASYALGASSPASSGTISPTANTFGPTVVNVCFAIDAKHNCVYVSDFFGNRVLRFSYPITSNLPSANLVFGQNNFTSSGVSTVSQNSLAYPQGLAVDTASGTLWILSQNEHRVLRFDNAYTITVNNPNASQVLGQNTFTTAAATTTQNGLNFNLAPQCANLLHYDQLSGALFVSDNGNRRVLRYDNAVTLLNGANANAVLGQSVYTTNSAGLTAATFGRPDGMTTIGTSLFVADAQNNRVLRYDNVYSKPDGAPADAVYGQSNFTSNAIGTTASTFNNPTGLTSDPTHLYVSELGNQRVTIFNAPLTNTVANNVLLTPNLTTPGSAAATPSTGGANSGIAFDPVYTQLLVQDRSNNRVLVFTTCPAMSITSASAVCIGSSIILNGSGAATYTWNTSATTSSILVSPSVTTVYSFTGTAGACMSITSQTVVVNALPSLSVSSTSSILCVGNTATITASGATSFIWNTTATVSAIAVSPTTTTSYSVTGTNVNGCSNNSVFTQSVSTCVGQIELANQQNELFSVYPNPNSGNFTIHLPAASEVIVYNVIGEIILKEEMSATYKIDISDKANGIYFAKTNVNGKPVVVKIIKQ